MITEISSRPEFSDGQWLVCYSLADGTNGVAHFGDFESAQNFIDEHRMTLREQLEKSLALSNT